MLEKLESSFAVKYLKWDGASVVWEGLRREGGHAGSACAMPEKSVLVVEDLRSATRGKRGKVLVKELAGMTGNYSIVVCSDVVPLYHYGTGYVD